MSEFTNEEGQNHTVVADAMGIWIVRDTDRRELLSLTRSEALNLAGSLIAAVQESGQKAMITFEETAV